MCTKVRTFLFVTPDRECHFSLEVSFYVCIQILRLRCLLLPSFRTFSADPPGRFLRSLAWGQRFLIPFWDLLLREVSEAFTAAKGLIKPSIYPTNRLQDPCSHPSMSSWHLMPASASLKTTLLPPCSFSSNTVPFPWYHFFSLLRDCSS